MRSFVSMSVLSAGLLIPMLSLHCSELTPAQMDAAVNHYYDSWKKKYLVPSARVPGDYKIKFDKQGSTVSEAMGYGMLITVTMAGVDPMARGYFDGLDRFRKRFPSSINQAFMCWKIPPDEHPAKSDSATDGDLDMALALLMAYRQWGDPSYFREATDLIRNLASSLVRPDFSLRLGDWNDAPGQTRTSDFMPTHFRAFQVATGDPLWGKVESRCYDILEDLQEKSAPLTGLVPDFAVEKNGSWRPAKPMFLESAHDGEFYYNACRVPWRIGWAAQATGDVRARRILDRFMQWATIHIDSPEDFRAGYHLNGTGLHGGDYDTACFISPTGVAALATGHRPWMQAAFAYGIQRKEGYYEESVNLLSLLVMSGKAWLPLGIGKH